MSLNILSCILFIIASISSTSTFAAAIPEAGTTKVDTRGESSQFTKRGYTTNWLLRNTIFRITGTLQGTQEGQDNVDCNEREIRWKYLIWPTGPWKGQTLPICIVAKQLVDSFDCPQGDLPQDKNNCNMTNAELIKNIQYMIDTNSRDWKPNPAGQIKLVQIIETLQILDPLAF